MGIFSRRPKVGQVADKYPVCPQCAGTTWQASQRAEMSDLAMGQRVKQRFDCAGCGMRVFLMRYTHQDKWSFYRR